MLLLASLTARPGPSKKRVVYRKLRKIDVNQFKKDILTSLVSDASDDASIRFNKYNTLLRELLDKHAPKKDQDGNFGSKLHWSTDTIRDLKTQKRRFERKMNKSGLEVDKQCYKDQCKR